MPTRQGVTFAGMDGTGTLALPARGGTAAAVGMLMLFALPCAGVAQVLAKRAEVSVMLRLAKQNAEGGLADGRAVQ